jgi:uncharacterized damage-inducible protein DinB
LSNLTLEQAIALPGHATHLIDEELAHAAHWQKIIVTRDEALYKSTGQNGEGYPSQAPMDEGAWLQLVEEFLLGIEQALEWTRLPERLALEIVLVKTMAEILRGLVVHNTYHLGKIVALRQVMGWWPNQSVI